MAKEQWHNWGRYGMLALAILAVGKAVYLQIHDNTNALTVQGSEIVTNRQDIKSSERRIDKAELSQLDLSKTNEAINLALIRIESGQKSFYNEIKGDMKEQRKAQQQIALDVAKTSTKVNQLTKD